MGIKKFEVLLHNSTGLPRDDAVNVLYYDLDNPAIISDVEDVMDGIGAAYYGLMPSLNSAYNNGLTIKAYDLAGGAPTSVKQYNTTVATGGYSPTEVALCLSYQADDGDSVAGRRGRIYLPLAVGADGTRPSTAHITALLDFGEDLASVGFGTTVTWHMWSQKANGSYKIEAISVDNEWDTQRRRGMRATTRTKRDVQ